MGEKPATYEKKRILYFQLFTWLGGGEYGIYDLVRNLDRSRFQPIVMFNKRGPFVDKAEESGVEVVMMPYVVVPILKLLHPLAIWKNLRASFTIKEYLKAHPVDIIQCSDVLSLMLLFPSLVSMRTPVVFSVIFRYRLQRAMLLNFFLLFGIRRIVSLSQWILDDLLSKTIGFRKKSKLVYWAVDTEKFYPRSLKERRQFLSTVGIPEGKNIIGFVGRFDVWKGHLTFIEAAKHLLKERDDLLFLIVGDAITKEVAPAVLRYHKKVLRRVEAYGLNGKVQFWKHRDDIPEVMSGFDIFVCPSDHEPFGLVLLEAMASGIPVVASDSGGPLEIIEDGKDGFLFATGNAAALQSAILKCLKAPYRLPEMTEYARAKVETEFTLERYARTMEEVYEEVLTK